MVPPPVKATSRSLLQSAHWSPHYTSENHGFSTEINRKSSFMCMNTWSPMFWPLQPVGQAGIMRLHTPPFSSEACPNSMKPAMRL